MRIHQRAAGLAALITVVCAGALVPGLAAGATSQTSVDIPTAAQTTTLSATEKTLLASSDPKVIVMNPTTGNVLSVTTPPAQVASPAISLHGVCEAKNACYFTDKTPYADIGFYGNAGTTHGTWLYRKGYSSGRYTVSACWTTGIKCGPEIEPDSEVDFTKDVTGSSFTIY
jgi:hypothetical protein